MSRHELQRGRPKLTPRMIEVLRHAAAGRPLDTGCSGRSARGGLEGTLFALRQRGLLRGMEITDAGRQALLSPGREPVPKGGEHG